MWWLLLLLVLGYFAWAKQREGMSSVSDMNLMQIGDIQKLDEQLQSIKYTLKAKVDAVQKCVDSNIENHSAVQATMNQSNTNEKSNAYPTDA